MVTEVPTVLIITQVSCGSSKTLILSFLAKVSKYLHAKIASLTTVKSCFTVGPIS